MKIKRRYKLILIILFAVILIISLYFILNKKKEVISLSIGDYISMNKMNYFYNKTYDNLYSKDVIFIQLLMLIFCIIKGFLIG